MIVVDEPDLAKLGFVRHTPARTGLPGYHPAAVLKLYLYGYLNRISSSRQLEREVGRNVELMWLTGRRVPDHKTIADFRRDNDTAIHRSFAQFVEFCRWINMLFFMTPPWVNGNLMGWPALIRDAGHSNSQ